MVSVNRSGKNAVSFFKIECVMYVWEIQILKQTNGAFFPKKNVQAVHN